MVLRVGLMIWAALLGMSLLAQSIGQWRRGDVLAFASLRTGNSEIYLLDMNTRMCINLTRSISEDSHPTWSPDGRQLAFVSNRRANNDVYIYDFDSDQMRNISLNEQIDNYPTWAADGRLAYVTNLGSGVMLRVFADGAAQDVMPLHDVGDLAWASIGLAYSSYAYGSYDVYVLDTSSREIRNVTNSGSEDFSPSWSADGRWLAFTSSRHGNPEIYLLELTSGDTRQMTTYAGADDNAVWSPDGRRLAFETYRDGNAEIYVMDVQTGAVWNVTQHWAHDYDAAWMP
jgi:TolB protein